MSKKCKVFVCVSLSIVTLFTFVLVSFAEVSSVFQEDPTYGYVYSHRGYSSNSFDISDIPSSCWYDCAASSFDGSYNIVFTNDLDVSVTFYFQVWVYSRSHSSLLTFAECVSYGLDSFPYISSANGNNLQIYTDSTVTLAPGSTFTFSASGHAEDPAQCLKQQVEECKYKHYHRQAHIQKQKK